MCYKCDFLGSWLKLWYFKQASEDSPNEFRSTCDSKDVTMKIC